jgi:hypothetical protein
MLIIENVEYVCRLGVTGCGMSDMLFICLFQMFGMKVVILCP